MTPVEISYFKHFLFDRGIQAIYISMYRKNRIKGGPDGDQSGNPESLEQFLQESPKTKVLMHAFYFQPNSNFGYDYWKEINKKWLTYLKMQEDNPQNDKVVVLKGSFGILRQNWDRPQYWKTETMEATYARMHMESPLKGVDIEKALYIPRSTQIGDKWAEPERKFKIGDIIRGNISEEILTITNIKDKWYETNDGGVIDFDKEEFWDKIDEIPDSVQDAGLKKDAASEECEEESDQSALLSGFSLVDTDNKHGGKKMKASEVSVNMKNNGYRITFSTKESDNLRKHKYEHVQLLTKEKTSEIALKFNHNNGCCVNIKGNKQTESKNVVINSKDIVASIHKFYKLPNTCNYFVLTISSTIMVNNDTIYILKYEE